MTLAARGSQTPQSGKQNQQPPTSGPGGYITPAALGVPNASKPGTKSAMARNWDMWLHNPRRHARPQRFKARDKISNSPQEGPVATELLPPRRSPPL